MVNQRVPQVSHRSLSARINGTLRRGAVISDPPRDPLAYTVLTAFMLREAVATLGPEASRAARKADRDAIDALSALMAPDGDVSYLGRGQGQVWVPAVAAAALASAARDRFPTRPGLAARYLAGAQRAVQRLGQLHTGATGLQLVPNAATRLDPRRDRRLRVRRRLQRARALRPDLRAGRARRDPRRAPSARSRPTAGSSVVDNGAGGGIGIVGNGRVWLAVHRTSRDPRDLRHDAGAVALKRRTDTGWVDLLAPRPLTILPDDGAGPR